MLLEFCLGALVGAAVGAAAWRFCCCWCRPTPRRTPTTAWFSMIRPSVGYEAVSVDGPVEV